MKQLKDKFSQVANQIACKNNAISDARFIKFITQDYIPSCYGSKPLELFFDGSGIVEAILMSGEIVQLDETMLGFKYRNAGML